MKNLITLLIVLLTVTTYGQRNVFKKKKKIVSFEVTERELITPPDFKGGIVYIGNDIIIDTTFNKDLVIREFVTLIDSLREYKYNRKMIPSVINPLMCNAAKHHNNYLTKMIDTNDVNVILLSHGEPKNALKDANGCYILTSTGCYIIVQCPSP